MEDKNEESTRRQYGLTSALAPLKCARENLLHDKERAEKELLRIDRMIASIERGYDIDDDLRRIIDNHMWKLETDGRANIAIAPAYVSVKDGPEFVNVGITLSFPSMACARRIIGKDNLETL